MKCLNFPKPDSLLSDYEISFFRQKKPPKQLTYYPGHDPANDNENTAHTRTARIHKRKATAHALIPKIRRSKS